MEFLGRSGDLVLFSDGSYGVAVDESLNFVVEAAPISSLASMHDWNPSSEPKDVSIELAKAAISDLDILVFSNNRLYTIPVAVKNEARRALDWRREHHRGGTPVGLNTARTLAKGGQIGIEKVRHIAKYFPRHEVDKKGKGYKPGEDGYPSNGRIAWALWGGDAARRWASAIVEREDKRLADASTYEQISPVDVSVFADENAQFTIRVKSEGSGIDRLYLSNDEGEIQVWDDCGWTDLNLSNASFFSYDEALDEENDGVSRFYFPVDNEAALVASALLDSDPFGSTQVESINVEEAAMVADALGEVDWQYIDSITFAEDSSKNDGKYTKEERSKNAQAQVRDATGRFAKMGSRVTISNNPQATGTVQGINSDNQTVSVKLDNGNMVDVPANITQAESATQETYGTAISGPRFSKPLDVSGILGEPRDSSNNVLAGLPNRLPPLTRDDIQTMLTDWPKWVADQRDAFEKTRQATPQVKVNTDAEDVKAPNAYNDPYLRKWLDKKYSKGGKSSYPNRTWYSPVRTDDIQKKKPASKVTFSTDSLVAAAEEAKKLTPETSDVPPIYMAIVAEDDPQAVMDLVSLVPENSKSTEPTTFSRRDGKWVKDEGVLQDLNSATPPPVIVLDDPTLKDVLNQMEGTEEKAVTASIGAKLSLLWDESGDLLAITSAGGLDRNRGNAEKLRRYWTVGKGGAKIRWGTGGDWTRCVRQLSKYMGPRAKGYCALRHKEMTGMWTGDKAHRQLYGRKGNFSSYSDEYIRSTEQIISNAELSAQANDARQRIVASAAPVAEGAEFYIPLVLPEGVDSGDGRRFSKGAVSMRQLPLPLMWQIRTAQGHDGSVVVGKIVKMERTDDGVGNAYGVFDTGEFGKEAERLVRGGFITGISADLDMFEASDDSDEEDQAAAKDEKKIGGGRIKITKGRIMGVTLVPKPAFQECKIMLVEDKKSSEETPEEIVLPDGEYVEEPAEQDSEALVACASVVASIPINPPAEWFGNPKLEGPTPLTVSDDGRVFGHIAAWHVDHIGLAFGTKPPRSKSKYSYFHTGVIRTEDGTDIPVGQLTLAGGHAALEASAKDAAKHYDDTGSAFADVHAGEDSYGIWVSGALRPSVTPEQVRAIRASAPSGDWRPIGGSLELVAVCQVNVPGFPIARARVASGSVMALVAAGARVLAQMKSDPVSDLAARVERLEQAELESLRAAAEDIRARFSNLKGEFIVSEEAVTADASGQGSMLAEVLEKLLSDVISFYFRAHGYHWNIRGEDFSEYHALFSEIYEDVYGSIDPLAENIRKVGSDAPFNLGEIITLRSIGDSDVQNYGAVSLAYDLCEANAALIDELKMVFNVCDSANEQGLANFIADRIDHHQKWDWQLKSSLVPAGMEKAEDESDEDFFVTVFSVLEGDGLIAAGPSQAVREKLAKSGEALPDGSYPIRNVSELKKAIKAYGRSNPEDRAKVRRHIAKRARALKSPDLIPDNWKNLSTSEELSLSVEDLRSRIASKSITAAAAEGSGDADPKALTPPKGAADGPTRTRGGRLTPSGQGIYTAKSQPRDAQGRFRVVLARLKQDLGVAELHDVAQRVAEVENLDNAGNYIEAAKGARDVIDIVSRLDTGALDATSVENVRSSVTALSKAISNLPLPFKDQAQKIRFSDVPPALADLMKDMIDKVEKKIGKKDADVATERMKSFLSGSDLFSQSEISGEMNKLLRLLT